MKCDVCFCTDTYVDNYEHVYHIKNEEIKFTAPRRFCKKCHNLVYDEKLDNEASEKALEIYNKNYGIPKEKIIELRNNYNLSQALFSKIIGCAKKTLISYEKGTALPNDNYTIILNSLIARPETIKNLIETNKQQFDDKEYIKITTKLAPFLNNNMNQLLDENNFTPTEYNGYTKMNIQKVFGLISYLSDKCILKTKLLKEMFYVDFLYYKQTGLSLTGLEYAKINLGPVPDGYEKIINECMKEKIIEDNVEFKNEYECHNIKSLVKPNTQIFSKEELKVIKKVKAFFSTYKVKDIVSFSHQEKAFTDTEFYKKISYDYSFDINRIL